VAPAASISRRDVVEQLGGPGLDDLGHVPSRDRPRHLFADRRDLHDLVGVDFQRKGRPCLILRVSATSGVTRRSSPRSLVTLRAPIWIVAQWRMEPSWNTATSVVSPPMSQRTTPSSRSSSVRTTSAVARGVEDQLVDLDPAFCTHFVRFVTLDDDARDDVRLDLETDGAHADRVTDASCPSTT
jgi:hypothetical protein